MTTGTASGVESRGDRAGDAAILAVLVVAYLGLVFQFTGTATSVYFDTFRDVATAENILAGRLWADPALRDYPPWYPPGNPLLMAAVARLTGARPLEVYAASRYWLNVLIPVLLYLLVRTAWDRATALLALPIIVLGSVWWATHLAAPMPSVHGVIRNRLGLLCWHQCHRPGWRWPVVTGLVLSAGVWHHPLCALILAGAIGLHALDRLAARDPAGRAWTGRMLVVAGITAVLAAPLVWHLLTLPRLNTAPMRYFAPELTDARFALYRDALAVPLLGLAGLWLVLRRAPAQRWLVAYVVITAAGQALGYGGHELRWRVPYIVPHEFQWHGQLALGIAAAGAAAALLRAAVAGAGRWRLVARLGLLAALASVGWNLRFVPPPARHFIPVDGLLDRQAAAQAWLRANTDIDTVCAADTWVSYFVIGGLSGRKVIATGADHMNPASPAGARVSDLRTLTGTTDEAQFLDLARRYGAEYLVVTTESVDTTTANLEHYATWPSLQRVFSDPEGRAHIFRVAPAP